MTRLSKIGAALLAAMMLTAILIPATTDQAEANNPCPHFSIQDVFDDPTGNWDGDQVNNVNELYNGLGPCRVDTGAFCSGGGNPLCVYPTYTYNFYSTACAASVNAYPNGDYDGDGVSNAVEVRNGANPCTHPCPNPTNIDLALNPNGAWDNDGVSNAIEVSQGTNPCNGYSYNPCPYYSYYQVDFMPSFDWDGDGITNANEVRNGTNPCVANYGYVYQQSGSNRLPHVQYVITTRAPVVITAPVAVPPSCPYGYPYYHPGNGLCYSNPISPTVYYYR